MESLAKKIIKYRAKNNLSMINMAKLCNVSSQTIWFIEMGKTNPTRRTLEKIMLVIEGDKDETV